MPLRILIVDDSQDIVFMLEDRLISMGFDVSTAGDGKEGMAVLERATIDGILLDIQMPVMDGLTMLEQIKKQYPRLPIIMMSADLNFKKLISTMQQGAHDYLLKPIDLDLLTKKCSSVFSLK